MYKIVLIRHGESEWNKANRFAGWSDVDLTSKGIIQARNAGKILKKNLFCFDFCYTSLLKRAIKTSNIILEEMNLMWIPILKDWRLNEKHYGDLQGKNRLEMTRKFGEDQVLLWRRSYDVHPPEIKKSNPYNQIDDSRYGFFKKPILAESLKDVVARVIPFWEKNIIPNLRNNKRILISASGNSLRAILKYLEKTSEKDIINLNIPYSTPIICEFDKNLKFKKRYYLGDVNKINKIIDDIKSQSKLK